MATIATAAEAARLNESGLTDPYVAVNGHRMVAPVTRPGDRYDKLLGIWTGGRDLVVGDEINYRSAEAYCVDGCPACADGEPLPDF